MRSWPVSGPCTVTAALCSTSSSDATTDRTPPATVSVASSSTRSDPKANRPRSSADEPARRWPGWGHAGSSAAHAHVCHVTIGALNGGPKAASSVSSELLGSASRVARARMRIAPELPNSELDPSCIHRDRAPNTSPRTVNATDRRMSDCGRTRRACSSTVMDTTRCSWLWRTHSPFSLTRRTPGRRPASDTVVPARACKADVPDPTPVTLPSTTAVRFSGIATGSNTGGPGTASCTPEPRCSSSTSTRRRHAGSCSCVKYGVRTRSELSSSRRRTPQRCTFASPSSAASDSLARPSHQYTVPAAACAPHDPYAAPARARTAPVKETPREVS